MLCSDACVVQQLLASCLDDGECDDPRGNSVGHPWWREVSVSKVWAVLVFRFVGPWAMSRGN